MQIKAPFYFNIYPSINDTFTLIFNKCVSEEIHIAEKQNGAIERVKTILGETFKTFPSFKKDTLNCLHLSEEELYLYINAVYNTYIQEYTIIENRWNKAAILEVEINKMLGH